MVCKCALQRCESALPTLLKHARAVMADSPFPIVELYFRFRYTSRLVYLIQNDLDQPI